MGTSSGYIAPSGGDWNSLKRQMGMLLDEPDKRNLVVSKFISAIGGSEGFSSSNKPTNNATRSSGNKVFNSSKARKTSQDVLGFFSDIHTAGLAKALQDRNLDLNNKNLEDIKEILIDYFSEPSTDADSDAASRAIATVMDKIFSEITTEQELDDYFSNVITTKKAEIILCGFYESYIYELFARTFFEDRTKHSNQAEAIEILEIVKETIKSKISTYQCHANLQNIDFKGQAGADFVRGILNDILETLEGE